MTTNPKDIVPFPMSDRHYAAIGKVAANWSALERLMDSLIWRIALVQDKEGACITAQIPNMGRRVEALISVIRLNGGSERLIKRYNKFVADTDKLQSARNRVVHDPWIFDAASDTPHRLEISARRKLVFEYLPMPTSEVSALVDKINSHIERFDELARATTEELDSARRGRLEQHLKTLPPDYLADR